MGYAVELSFNAKKTIGLLKKQEDITVKARQHNCTSQYNMIEMEGFGRSVHKSESIHVVMFDEDTISSMYEFIKYIRREKLAYVDCIYRDDCTCDLLYASGHYLRKLDKPSSLKIRRSLKTPTDKVAIDILKIIKSK